MNVFNSLADKRLRVTGVILAILALGPSSWAGSQGSRNAAESGRIAVLAELFTSEGCSSCPPADRLLAMVGAEQPADGVYVVALSEHVTYWDHQGWKDPFASPQFTERQSVYGRRFNLESIYTPQLVIDGHAQMVGSDADELRRALASASRTPKPMLTVDASMDATGAVVAVASGPGLQAGGADGAALLWAVTEDDLIVDVKRGENAQRTLRHSGVVRSLVSRKIDAGTTSERAVMPLHAGWKHDKLRVVAFVQATKSGRVLSVGWSRLPVR